MRLCCIEVLHLTLPPEAAGAASQPTGLGSGGEGGGGAVQPLGAHRYSRAGGIAGAKTKLMMLPFGWLGLEPPHAAHLSPCSGTRAKQSPSQVI